VIITLTPEERFNRNKHSSATGAVRVASFFSVKNTKMKNIPSKLPQYKQNDYTIYQMTSKYQNCLKISNSMAFKNTTKLGFGKEFIPSGNPGCRSNFKSRGYF
jgi:hypothetical protein